MRNNRVRKAVANGGAGSQSPVSPAPAAAESYTILTPEFDVVGSIYVDARVRLEGSVDGEIRCTTLDITRQGEVRGTIVAEEVTIYGTVLAGTIYARVLILKPGCSVEAEIYHEHLQLEAGSYFDGKSRRVDDAIGMAPG
jgi:cytoskeletal protein CcmA (bactofilin family)